MSELVLVDEPAAGVRRLRLNRPERANALSRALVAELIAQLDRIESDTEIRCAVLAAAGRSFCGGADLSEHFVSADEAPDIGLSPLWDRLTELRVPVIAAVQGHAVTGGFLLAYSCDLIVAASDAVFRDTHAVLGLLPTGGESQRLPRLVGPFLARELMLTSRPLPAEEALRAGLVNAVVEPEELDRAALELAATIAAASPRSVQAIKQLINRGLRGDLASGLALEREVNRDGAANLDPDPERERRLARFRDRS